MDFVMEEGLKLGMIGPYRRGLWSKLVLLNIFKSINQSIKSIENIFVYSSETPQTLIYKGKIKPVPG